MTNSRSIELVVFDWGGTTVDFGCCAPVAAFQEALASRGVEISVEQARIPMGLHKRDHIRELLKMEDVTQRWRDANPSDWTEADVEALYEAFIPFQKDVAIELTQLTPGVLECQEYLRSRQIPIGSSTGYPEEVGVGVCEKAREFGFSPDQVFFADQVPAGRPAPWMIFRNMEAVGAFPPSRVVKIGDTVPDILAGRNAGSLTVGVTSTSSEVGLSESEWNALSDEDRRSHHARVEQKLRNAGADRVIESLVDLPDVLEDLSREIEAQSE